jgi:acetyl-CoA carboxylase carboxyltransferase component
MDKVFSILPESRTQVYDMKRVLRCVVDKDTLFELKPRFGKSAVTALARLGGKVSASLPNNPLHRGGALDADACRKIVDFVVMCDSFNVPLVILVDTPVFQIGTDAERAGAPGKIMNFMNAMTLVTVPHISVIVRKSYGRAYVAWRWPPFRYRACVVRAPRLDIHESEFATKLSLHLGVSVGEADRHKRFERTIKQRIVYVWVLLRVLGARSLRPEQTRIY